VKKATVIGVLALTLTLAACSSGDTSSTAAPSKPAPTACPTGAPPAAGPPAGAPAGAPALVIAKTITPSDTSTSTVLKPSVAAQIQCGRAELATHNDVVYSTPTLPDGKPLALKLDILAPKSGGAKPLVVYVPGGGFIAAGKEGGLNRRTFVAEAGYVVASIQYRTTLNGAVYSDGIADVKSAVRYLRANAAKYRIDPKNVAVWGESAGAYLSAMTGVTNGLKQFEAGDNLDQSSEVQAVVDQFGASDLSKIAADFDPAAQQGYAGADNAVARYVTGPKSGKTLAQDPAAVAKANPITYVAANSPAFLLFHGSKDTIISPSQTLLLHNALRKAGADSTRYVVDGADHGDLAFLGNPKAGLPWTTQELMGHLTDFLATNLT
jgi:acetyl esterase/lipase